MDECIRCPTLYSVSSLTEAATSCPGQSQFTLYFFSLNLSENTVRLLRPGLKKLETGLVYSAMIQLHCKRFSSNVRLVLGFDLGLGLKPKSCPWKTD